MTSLLIKLAIGPAEGALFLKTPKTAQDRDQLTSAISVPN
jgi:hypothetical protein